MHAELRWFVFDTLQRRSPQPGDRKRYCLNQNHLTMASFDFNLSEPPSDSRQRELWLQHAIGFILFQDVRDYALQQVDPLLNDDAKAAATKAINDAVYGLMMVLDGVTGALANESQRVNLRVVAELVDTKSEVLIESLDLMDGDGMYMGYHGWIENDFGESPPITTDPKSQQDRQ